MMTTKWWQNTTLCRYYAWAAAVALVSLGLAGFFDLGLGWDHLANSYHLVLGLFLGYAGLFVRDKEAMRLMVGGLGTLMVLVKSVTVLFLWLVGERPLWGPVEVTCFVLGITSILAARFLRDVTPRRERVR